ncbi:MAG: ATP-dependent DNA helicase [Bacillota bacterium]|nr:ATP-dependent DNA helicase [Bacillota bacterium]
MQHNFEKISVQLTYVEIDNYEARRFIKDFDFKDLKEDFLVVIEDYLEFAYRIDDWSKIRDESIMNLKFPFGSYRKGQREMAICVYKTIKEKKKAFIQAPTGIGKTISTIFPTVKAIAEGHTSKIFYLTSKTITRTVAQEGFRIMRKKGLRFKSLTITAKDKICFEPESACIPQECSYAKGHFNRVNDALEDMMLNEDEFSKEVIEKYSKKHHVCPFEFSLDAALVADCVICDYNYVFDPRVNLKRFFEDVTKDYAFLVDEAHNLVDRARGMYSAVISKQPLLAINRSIKNKKEDEKLIKLSKVINKYNKALLQFKNDCIEKDEYVFKEPPAELYKVMRSFANHADVILNERKELSCYDSLLDYYFQTLTFLNISELYDERYTTYAELKGNDIYIHLFCVDPSYLLNQKISNGSGTIFFSATLSPIKYFHRMYSRNKEDYTLLLDSPFDHGNRSYMIASDIMTTYKKRAFSYKDIALYLREFAQSKLGNYIVYFSSYAYKKEVLEAFEMLETDVEILDQQRELTEIEKEEFLDNFKLSPEKSMMGFCVLGGSFSEGVDLRGDRLIGTAIVGVGLPMVCLEREIIKNYHEDHDEEAFNYAYVYPGLNKVMQAAGRVIRTEEDKGVIILMDERYNYSSYRQVIPYDWQPQRTYRRSFRNDIDKVWNQISSCSASSFEK